VEWQTFTLARLSTLTSKWPDTGTLELSPNLGDGRAGQAAAVAG
jgi:hypothetical protein